MDTQRAVRLTTTHVCSIRHATGIDCERNSADQAGAPDPVRSPLLYDTMPMSTGAAQRKRVFL
jgi:hypothetical protein